MSIILKQNPANLRDFFIFSFMRKNLYKIYILTAFMGIVACNSTQNSTDRNVVISEKSTTEKMPASSKAKVEVSDAAVKQKLDYLASNELMGRATGTEGIEKAAVYIEDFFRKNNIKPYYDTYRNTFQVDGKTGFNIVGYLPGTDPALKDEFIILGAHYDHIGIGKKVGNDSIANGANDNAAGTVAVMELADLFAETGKNKRSILFILFSAEEMGLEGSKAISRQLKEDNLDLYAMVNFEMIGIPMQGKDHLAYITGYDLSNFADKFNEYSEEKVIGFLPQAKQFNLFQRSDNYPFYQDFKVPAQTISSFDFTNYDYYHHVSDEAEKMDVAHMANVIEKVFPGLYKMANSSEKEIKMNQ